MFSFVVCERAFDDENFSVEIAGKYLIIATCHNL
jgi:hypothetical protein